MTATETETRIDQVKLVGGNPALDFANIVAWDDDQPLAERLRNYEMLLDWARYAGVLSEDDQAALRQAAAREPELAHEVLEEAIALRGAIHRIGAAVAGGREPQPHDMDQFNAALARAMSHSRLSRDDEGYAWAWDEAPALERPLWPLVRAMADLLASGQLGRLRECQGDRCGWLFIDSSKSGRRRWCTMEDCGNRAKARRYYQRHKGAADTHPHE